MSGAAAAAVAACFVSAPTTVAVSLLGTLRSITKRVWRSTSVAMCRVVLRPGEQIAFPVTRHGAVLSLGRPFADGDGYRRSTAQSALCVAALGLTHLPRRPQMRHPLLLQHAAGLNKADFDRSFSCDNCMPWSAGSCRFLSHPEICSGDHCSASFCATRHRSLAWRAGRQNFGRNARCQARADRPSPAR